MFLPPFLQSLPDASEAKQEKKNYTKNGRWMEMGVLNKNENLDPLRFHRQMRSRKAPTRECQHVRYEFHWSPITVTN